MLRVFCGDGELWLAEKKADSFPAMDLMFTENEATPAAMSSLLQSGKKILVRFSGGHRLRLWLKQFHTIPAAGGVVLNREHQVLLIFRKGRWDLPKGKMDAGEGRRQAALREVMEETGLTSVRIVRRITFQQPDQPFTAHIYLQDKEWMLKKTWWYLMRTESQRLIPQVQEGITDLGWFGSEELTERMNNSYPLIRQVLRQSGLLPSDAG
ncbi:MAG: NUDIX domain-containing protein [Chitinophagales bacterium]|nr:NUDIX domain-containing protein [Chitinophagales bacterium]MDW8394000.1 NUDIX domain-containing protein [Chitinophagales bacterium]